MSKTFSMLLFSAVLLCGIGLYSILGQAQDEPVTSTNIAEQQLAQMLEKYKGDVIYLDFWASWCVPCRKSFPWMNAMQEKYQDQGFRVITINLDVDKAFAKDFLKDHPAEFPIIYDPSGKLGEQYQLKGMPSSFVIGRDGSVVENQVGFFEDKVDEYEQKIVEILSLEATN
ncbi:TlpA disulfide reductase family protein [Thalassotalea sp. PS06]|uniref:TlpA disulfide reductase family protein n=1 Tax=Thalassotalea sp. PS06 TaxID=2594005 RepID=UPI001162B43F|nr:TlpA disulfide reductase family protein [Thalassotalea sp. PS06]QDP02375.1 TlpA family protein disulfide reductase [Thalassotalea sp. PS06]